MKDLRQFYINGQWVDPVTPRELGVVNPATETVVGTISMGSSADVDKAVTAARAAFESFGRTSRQERIELLEAVLAEYIKRKEDIERQKEEDEAKKRKMNDTQSTDFYTQEDDDDDDDYEEEETQL